MNPKIFFLIFNITLIILACILFFKMNNDYGKVLTGDNWQAKQYGNKYIVSLNNRSEVVSTLTDFVKTQKINVGTISGLGAVNSATLRFFNPETKQYVDKTFNEQMEISNLIGNISTKDSNEYLHIHATFGNSEYKAIAGHLMSAIINGAAEFEIEAYPNAKVERKFDSEIGLNIYDFGEKK